jgi:hypothetical protein
MRNGGGRNLYERLGPQAFWALLASFHQGPLFPYHHACIRLDRPLYLIALGLWKLLGNSEQSL